MGNETELSIVVLCYRSEEAIIPFVEKVKDLTKKLTEKYEIILVANYIEDTKDRTKEIVEQIACNEPQIRVEARPKKGMMGWDMTAGMSASKGKYICVIDGDGQFPTESIEKCYHEIKTGKYGIVMTYRAKRHDGLYRISISKVYNFMFSLLFPGIGSKDINSKPKMLTNKAYQQMTITSTDWFIDAEIMLNARRMNMKVLEFPVEFYENTHRVSFVKPATILEFVKNITKFRIKEWNNAK